MHKPLITMSAITGSPSENDIRNYMRNLKENGIDQVMLYPRSGCEIEYLSDRWFCTIQMFLKAAEQLDMAVWLYDEFNWPSGDAGGRVTQNEAFRLKSIEIRGEHIGRIRFHSLHNASLFGEKFFPDLLSHEAVDAFIECTHKKYDEWFHAYFGTVIKGIFTDEPAVGYCCTQTSIPYYNGMETDYAKKFNRDFDADMKSDGSNFCKNAAALIADRFRECYIEKIGSWCRAHGVILTGHLMSDDAPLQATRQNGNILEVLSSFTMPGIDEIRTDFQSPHLLTLLSTVEAAKGDSGAMAELFALGPCDMTYAKKRCMLFLTACFKVNHYFLAVSHMDLSGNRKICDYFNDFSADQPDFAGTRLLAAEAEAASGYADKDFTPDIYIRYPTDLCANHLTDDFNDRFFTDMVNALSFHQLQWKFLDRETPQDGIPVLEFTENSAYRLGDWITTDPQAVCSRFKAGISVTDPAGHLPGGLFVRRFDDGTFIVLNLYDENRMVKINGMDVELHSYGVWRSDRVFIAPGRRRIGIPDPFRVRCEFENTIRTTHLRSAAAELHSDRERTVRFAVRKDTSACLNGRKIECSEPARALPAGMRTLYDISKPVTLKKGVNMIRAECDYKYLPSVFVLGDFSCRPESGEICRVLLRDRKSEWRAGEFFSDYGKVEFTAELSVPDCACGIELKGTDLYTRIDINGLMLGEKICAPYLYELDPAYKGKTVTVKITQYSSIAPIFGDTDYIDKVSEKVQWRGTPSTRKTLFGFQEINWVLPCE